MRTENNLTLAQARAIVTEIQGGAVVNAITTHPYSGVATLANERETVSMLNADGEVSYRPAPLTVRALLADATDPGDAAHHNH